MPFAVLEIDGSQIAKSLSPNVAPIAGVLGLETFERFAIRIDYVARLVTLALLPGFHYER